MNMNRSYSCNAIKLGLFLIVCLAMQGFSQAYTDLTVTNRESINNGGVTSSNDRLYVYHSENGAGKSGIYGYRNGVGNPGAPTTGGGTAWTPYAVDAGVKGFSYNGDNYSAGVAAFSWLDNPNSAAFVSADNSGNYAALLTYKDPLSNNCIWSGRFMSNIVMGPQTAGQRWIIFTDSHWFTIAPDLGTNFDWTKNFTINKNGGQVGIGVAPPDNSTYRLAVNGNAAINGSLSSTSIIVTAAISPWPDYVFNKNYKARPLSETESYIKKNGHLPGMPSKDDVAKNGINVGEMQAKLLKTMEEMTLQMIALKKENEQLKTRLGKVEKRY